MIAGDVYDKSVPSIEAITVFDTFLNELFNRKIETFIIAGNHDSPERLSFGNRLIEQSGIHISSVYNGSITPFHVGDEWGDVNVFMLPFVRPCNVRSFFPEEDINSYTDAVKIAVGNISLDKEQRNIMITHQFVGGALKSGSEEISVGGTDVVDASVFEDFDYTALGHIHRPQTVISEKIRYCGSPLKFSFSEVSDEKSVTVVELREKGDVSVTTVPLHPLHDMREISGRYIDVTAKKNYDGTDLSESYLKITLTDEEDIPDAVSKLRTIYHRLMQLNYDNTRTKEAGFSTASYENNNMTPLEIFSEFYFRQNNRDMSNEQREYINRCINEIWKNEES